MTGRSTPAGSARTVVVSAPAAARSRRHRALLGRAAVLAVGAALGVGTFAFLGAGAAGWAAICGGLALLCGVGLSGSALLGRRVVAVTVRGASMQPTYQHGDRVLVRRRVRLARGQVVVAEQIPVSGQWTTAPLDPTAGALAVSGRRWLIKRVVAVPGDPVPRDRAAALADVPEDRVPPGKVVLLGDNAEVSYDSRQLGYFPAERVLGAVLNGR
ncbi:S26 family signal peptidase [Plantactinospora sonchi]|uniref:S26 family signal peptidase n=1 Tax=Plantactinospora sonchi TaxID=1544735 RepID=A0ABU7RXS1_9ACTN